MAHTLLVLAAGIGSRYGGLKQIDPIGPGGEIVIDYALYDALRAGFGRVVFIITRELRAEFEERFSKSLKGRMEVAYVHQELGAVPPGFTCPAERKKPWGTGHAIMIAGEAIREPFAVINGDDFYGSDSFKNLGGFLGNARDGKLAEYAMVGFILRNTLSDYGTVARGVCTPDEKGFLKHIVEITGIARDGSGAHYTDKAGQEQRLTGDEIASMNLWAFTPSIFEHLQREFRLFMEKHGQNIKAEFYIPSVVDKQIVENRARVKILPTHSKWFGMTYKEDRPVVQRSIRELIRAGEYPERLWD